MLESSRRLEQPYFSWRLTNVFALLQPGAQRIWQLCKVTLNVELEPMTLNPWSCSTDWASQTKIGTNAHSAKLQYSICLNRWTSRGFLSTVSESAKFRWVSSNRKILYNAIWCITNRLSLHNALLTFYFSFGLIFLLTLPLHKQLEDGNERGTLQVHCFQFESWSTTVIHSTNPFIGWLIGVFCFENGPVLV